MKSPCLHCGKEVAHTYYERPFCSVGCNADYSLRLDRSYWEEAGEARERSRIVAWIRAEAARAWQLDGPGMMSPEWICEAIESGAHFDVKT